MQMSWYLKRAHSTFYKARSRPHRTNAVMKCAWFLFGCGSYLSIGSHRKRECFAQSREERVLKKHIFEGLFVFSLAAIIFALVGFELAWGSSCEGCDDTLPHYALHWCGWLSLPYCSWTACTSCCAT
jgi:hypothetical protein